MVISLVERCGVIANLFPELEQLCALVKLDPKDVRERLHRMQKTNGLVARAGRYFYVSPTPIAMVCFQAAWSKWAELDAKHFLESFPRTLYLHFSHAWRVRPRRSARSSTPTFATGSFPEGETSLQMPMKLNNFFF